ncbi:unnamed protein product [Gordionus sp. m RMFG-2023]
MGLFLQQTNIIRDVREDVLEKRRFWPSNLLFQYLKTNHYDSLIEPKYLESSIAFAKHLIYLALKHVPNTLLFLALVKDPSIFRFCAIPQVMAIATLTLCYDNPALFENHVKIPRSETVKIFNNCQDLTNTKTMLHYYALKIKHKMSISKTTSDIESSIEHKKEMCHLMDKILSLTLTEYYQPSLGKEFDKSTIIDHMSSISRTKIYSPPIFWIPRCDFKYSLWSAVIIPIIVYYIWRIISTFF